MLRAVSLRKLFIALGMILSVWAFSGYVDHPLTRLSRAEQTELLYRPEARRRAAFPFFDRVFRVQPSFGRNFGTEIWSVFHSIRHTLRIALCEQLFAAVKRPPLLPYHAYFAYSPATC